MRTVVLSDGREFKCERDANGLWSITPANGPLPKFLIGAYTDFGTAEAAIQAYASKKEATVAKVDVKDTPSIFA